jgi:hypothetical protein
MFGYQDPGNYYRFTIDRRLAQRRLVKFVNGVASLLAEDKFVHAKDVWHSVEARMSAGVIGIRVNGRQVFQVADVSHTGGKVAVYTWGNRGARFDSVVVSTEGLEGCSYSIPLNEVSVGSRAGNGSVVVSADAGCTWNASSSAAWVQITSGEKGTGSGVVDYSIQPYAGAGQRQATLAIAGGTLVITQAGTGESATTQVLFGDDFTNGLGSYWSVVDEGQNSAPSSWQASGGVLTQTSAIGGGGTSPIARPGTYLQTGADTWTDYQVSVRMRSSQSGGSIGLMFGYTGPGDYYRFAIGATGRRLVKFAGGTPSVLANDDEGYKQDRWYEVEARMINGRVRILVDGKPVFQVADTSHDSGSIALYTSENSGGGFDDVKVTADGPPCTYAVSTNQATIGGMGGTGEVAVTAPAGCGWTSSSGASWISITSGSSGSGDGMVQYSVQANPADAPREAVLTIAGLTVTITQQAAPACIYSTAPSSRTVGPAATTGSVAVATQSTCQWTTVSSASWLTVTSGASGTGNGKVDYSVQSYTGSSPRTATLTIGGETFTLSQLGSSGCQVELKPAAMTVGHWASTATIAVTTSPNCDWEVSSSTPWLTVTWPKTATGSGKANFKIQENDSSSQRTGSVTIGNAIVQVTQLAAGASNVIHVPPEADLQEALDRAQPGDTITLQAGVVYSGSFWLRKKAGTEPITITTSNPSLLPPAGTRVKPGYSGSLPILSSPTQSPVFKTEAGASHYRLIGLEITSPTYSWDLIRLGSFSETNMDEQSKDFVLDRLFIHGDANYGSKRGITLNTASSVIRNCYISDIKGVGQETQAIIGWNGPGPYEITNNYLEAAGENLMFGGAVAKISGLVPSDILIKGNHFYKQPSWRAGHAAFAGKVWTVKNLLELKNARRVRIEGNVMEHNWSQAQAGYAIVFTPRTEGGRMEWAVVEDIVFERNIVRHSGAGVNILGRDGEFGGVARRITFRNNIFDDINHVTWPGEGRLFQFLNGAQDITVDHNTFVSSNVNMAVMFNGAPAVRLVYTNNLLPHGNGGVYGSGTATGNPTLNHYAPGAVFQKNVLVGAPAKASWYPANNFFPGSFADVGFENFAGGDYRLSALSPYKNAGSDGKDIGANVQAVQDEAVLAITP